VNYDKIVFLGGLDDALEKIELHHLRRRIMRKTDDQHFRLGPTLPDRFLEMAEKFFARGQRNAAQIAAGEHHGVLMNRIGWTRAKNDVARIDGGPSEVRDAFLGTDGDDRFGIGIEIHSIAALIPVANRHTQLVDAAGH
jgi:hypothetical protein